jgi:hypothetical protein
MNVGPIFGPRSAGDQTLQRYWEVRLPPNIFAHENSFEEQQCFALTDWATSLLQIERNGIDVVESMGNSQQKYELICYKISGSDDSLFKKKKSVVIAAIAAEKMYIHIFNYRRDLGLNSWNDCGGQHLCTHGQGASTSYQGR